METSATIKTKIIGRADRCVAYWALGIHTSIVYDVPLYYPRPERVVFSEASALT